MFVIKDIGEDFTIHKQFLKISFTLIYLFPRNPYESMLPTSNQILRPVARRMATWTATAPQLPHHPGIPNFELPLKNQTPLPILFSS